jgi:hypothetical protein
MGACLFRRSSMGAGLTFALLVSACVSSAERSNTRAAVASPGSGGAPRLTEAWRNTTLHPIDQPKAIGSVAVGVVTGPDRTLFVIGIDPATGVRLWQQPLTPSRITPGVQVDLTKVGDGKVAYFRPTREPGFAELVIADARTGRDIVRSPQGLFSSPAELCPDGRDVCTTWAESFSSSRDQYRLIVATGEFLPDNSGGPISARTLSKSGLLDLGDRPGNTLGLLRDGKLLWTTPVSAAFPPDFSSDHGWSWHLFANQHVLVGTVYGPSKIVDDKYIREWERTSATAGLAERTGEVLWRDLGSTLHCSLGREGATLYPVRCRVLGTTIHQVGAGTTFEGLDVTVEGFDVTTGKTTWAVPVGAAEGLAGASTRLAIAGATHAVLQGPAGPMALDYATGRVTTPAAGATFWCMTRMDYEFWQPYQTRDGTSKHTRPGGELASICDSRGFAATELPGVAATMAAGARIGSHAVIATRDGYIGLNAR